MYSEETKSSTLAKFFAIYDYVFVDTCSLMEDSFPSFMDTLKASKEYWKEGFKVIVLGECVHELKKHMRGKDNQEARIEAKRALKILRHDRWHGKTLTITKSNSNYGFADNAIFSTVSSLRIQKKILIITQDKTLATDLRKLNNLDSQRGRYVEVFRLNANGELEENPGEQSQSRNSEGRYVAKPTTQTNVEKHSFFHHESHVSTTPVTKPATPKSPVAGPLLPVNSPIFEQDRHLSANLTNPNYPVDKKIADIEKQLSDLNALVPETRDRLSLAYTPEQLVSEKTKLSAQAPKPAVVTQPAVHPEAAAVKPVVPAKPVTEKPKVEDKAIPVVNPIAKGWFEYGKTVQEGLTKCGIHHNWIFRDSSVAYFAAVHGPYDITRSDLDQVALQTQGLKPGESKDVAFKGLVAHIEKTSQDFKCFLEAEIMAKPVVKDVKTPVSEPIIPPSAEPVVAKAPKVVSKTSGRKPRVPKVQKTVSSSSTPTATKPVASQAKKAVEPSSASKPQTSNGGLAATPSGATLIVGVPTDEGKRAFLERRSRREDNPAVSIVKKASPSKKAVTKAVPVRKAVKAVPASAKTESRPEKATRSPELEAALKEDNDLNAKLNNPTYPKDSAIKALEAQKNRLGKLKASDTKSLHYTSSAIDAKLKELKAK